MSEHDTTQNAEDGVTTYCYGRGATKHIANGPKPGDPTELSSFCGGWFDTEEAMRATYHRWNMPLRAEKYIAGQLGLPTCKRCIKAARIDGQVDE